MKKYRTVIIIGLIITVILVATGIMLISETTSGNSLVIHFGSLESAVKGRGEVNGEKSLSIDLPEALRHNELRVWSYKITNLVEEGKKVKKGDFIVQLDQSELMNNMRQRMTEKEKIDADLKNAIIDSAVTLTAKREDIVNARLDLQYKQIDLDMSKYESGAQQRKTQMEYQKTQIELDRKKRNYLLSQNRLKFRIMRNESYERQKQDLLDKYQEAIRLTRITSPGDGIVMIGEDFMGKKLSKDSRVAYWNPTIATLPDMSSAIVKTYIKEIDITKISKGDSVHIVVDAMPDKSFAGKVIKIANMGEEKSGFDMKVFEVIIRFDHTDPDLKPGMTCNNDIVVDRFDHAILAPLNAIFSHGKSSFVYLKKGSQIVRQPVKLGSEDENNVVVLDGLEDGDRVLLYEPDKEDVGS